jgi:hypothetical protein
LICRTARSGGNHDNQWPQALAATADYVFGHLIDQHDIAGEAVPDDEIDLVQVRGDQLFDGLKAHVMEGKTKERAW